MNKIMDLVGSENGNNGTWYKILDVKSVDNIKMYPSVKNGKVLSVLDVGLSADFFKHKVEIVMHGYLVLLQGNGVCAAEDIKDMLGKDYEAMSVSPNYVEVYKKADYESGINNAIKAGVPNGR